MKKQQKKHPPGSLAPLVQEMNKTVAADTRKWTDKALVFSTLEADEGESWRVMTLARGNTRVMADLLKNLLTHPDLKMAVLIALSELRK